ncbi:MAG: hypothetical protein JXN65_06400 [Clostridia bacterium]|nr:hypothetical protein [Clostridia bacterium]
MDFTYDIEVSLSSKELRRGRKASVEVKIKNATKEIEYCEGALKKYKGQKKLNQTGIDTYGLSAPIPIIAPKGTYEVEIYAVSRDGEKGPAYDLEIKII